MAGVEPDPIWNDQVTTSSYGADSEKYQQAILEQYKICIEMADRVSGRRGLTNTFFLSFNTALAAIAASILSATNVDTPWIIISFIAIAAQCAIWYSLLRSYRGLASAKYRIIGRLEGKLPATPWSDEWNKLGSGSGIRRYWRLGLLEQWIPLIFILIHGTNLGIYLNR